MRKRMHCGLGWCDLVDSAVCLHLCHWGTAHLWLLPLLSLQDIFCLLSLPISSFWFLVCCEGCSFASM